MLLELINLFGSEAKGHADYAFLFDIIPLAVHIEPHVS